MADVTLRAAEGMRPRTGYLLQRMSVEGDA
jgi:hypothetical protein